MRFICALANDRIDEYDVDRHCVYPGNGRIDAAHEHAYVRLRQDVSFMNGSVAGMNQQMTNLTGSVGAMGYNVNRMAAPARMMPFP